MNTQSYESIYAIIIPALLGIIGALLTFIICFKKQPGSFGKKGLFATAMLGIYILFAQTLVPSSYHPIFWKQLFIPMGGFIALAIIEIFNRDEK